MFFFQICLIDNIPFKFIKWKFYLKENITIFHTFMEWLISFLNLIFTYRFKKMKQLFGPRKA